MVDVRRVTLPGVGVLHSFAAADGGEVAVVAHRTGSSDLVSRPPGARDDDDAVTVRLDEDEAHTLAELLGGDIVELAGKSVPDNRRGAGVEILGNAEIDDRRPVDVVLLEDDIVRRHVAVNRAELVRRGQAGREAAQQAG